MKRILKYTAYLFLAYISSYFIASLTTTLDSDFVASIASFIAFTIIFVNRIIQIT